MAIIVSSQITEDSAQKDGRRWIRERHTDTASLIYEFAWMAARNQDAQAVMNARVADLEATIIAGEIASNLADVLANGSLATPRLIYSTAGANFAALRAYYGSATRQDAIMIGDFLSSLTDAQLKAAFNLTNGQVTTLRTNKLTPAATLAAAIRSAAGQ